MFESTENPCKGQPRPVGGSVHARRPRRFLQPPALTGHSPPGSNCPSHLSISFTNQTARFFRADTVLFVVVSSVTNSTESAQQMFGQLVGCTKGGQRILLLTTIFSVATYHTCIQYSTFVFYSLQTKKQWK